VPLATPDGWQRCNRPTSKTASGIIDPMTETLLVAAVQPVCAAREVGANALAHADAVLAATTRLVVFPELSLTGYELDTPAVSTNDSRLVPIVEACRAVNAIALVGAPIEQDGRAYIAALWIDSSGVRVAYRKTHLGGDEPRRFASGDGPTALEVDGRRVGIGICKDTGMDEHIGGVADLGVDLYVAGLVHHAEELAEQDRRGRRIALRCAAPVVFASFAGPTGGGFDRTAGTSAAWTPDGTQIVRAGADPGDLVCLSIG
jgi:predicted amidohydrolase